MRRERRDGVAQLKRDPRQVRQRCRGAHLKCGHSVAPRLATRVSGVQVDAIDPGLAAALFDLYLNRVDRGVGDPGG